MSAPQRDPGRRSSGVLDRLVATVLRALTAALAHLPHGASRTLGTLLGRLAWWLRLPAARTTLINLEHALPGQDVASRRALAKASLEENGRLIAEAGLLFHGDTPALEALVVATEGVELLEASLEQGDGVLVLVPHFGNWEYLGLFLGRYGLVALYDPPRLTAVDAPLRESRERTGAALWPINRQGLRRVRKTLGSGGLVGILPDQVPAPGAGVHADFFGRPALTMTLAHRLIRSTGARVLLGAAQREPRGFRIRFHAVSDALHAQDAEVSARAMNEAIETLVRERPAQYLWAYKRFKKGPPGGAKLYQRGPPPAVS